MSSLIGSKTVDVLNQVWEIFLTASVLALSYTVRYGLVNGVIPTNRHFLSEKLRIFQDKS